MVTESVVSSVPTIPSTSVKREHLSVAVQAELSNTIKGTVHPCGESSFALHSKLFNGDVIVQASLLVRPFDVEDVSEVIKFCTRHSLSLSVKAGGYGTHGKAVQGDIILDISLLNDIQIETMNPEGGFTSIKDMPSLRNAGKAREEDHNSHKAETSSLLLPQFQEYSQQSSGKRRAEEAFEEHLNRTSSIAPPQTWPSVLTSFERGIPLQKIRRTEGTSDISPSIELHSPPHVANNTVSPPERPNIARQKSSAFNYEEGSSGSGASSHFSHSLPSSSGGSISTKATSADSPTSKSPPSQSDPFGYLSDPPSAGSSSIPALPTSTFDISLPNGLAAPGPNFSQPFSSSFISPSGHYMPARVKPDYPHAFVTFGAGAKQKDVDSYTSTHPLPATSIEGIPCFTPYHVPFSAHPVGSSVMLLGGFGFLSRLHGLSIDNLVEVEMVLADGSIVVVNETDHPDLWWAMRGAGTAFGIATRYKAKAYPIPVVFAGNLLYKFRRSTAASLIKHFRDCIKNVPRELYANVILTAGPDGDALLVIQICYLGPQEQGAEFLQAIMSWDGEQCLLNEVSEKSFLNQQDSLAQLINGKAGRKWFIRSDLLGTLSDETIHDTVMKFADTPIGCTWLFELSGGCVSDDHGGCFPASVRQANWTIAAFHQWELDEDDPRCVSSAEDWLRDTLGPASTGGPFPSFFGIHESRERIQGSFGENWQRLVEVKRKYDPTGLFKHNFWPIDKNGETISTLVPTHTEF